MTDLPAIALVPDNPRLAAALTGVRIVDPAEMTREGGALWVFVDSLLPDSSGLEFCRRLRASESMGAARIVIVLEDDDRELRRRALRAGADDYVIGPLRAEDVLTRVGLNNFTAAAHEHSRFQLDREAFQSRVDGKLLTLAPNEFNLLAHFLQHRDRLLSRRELIGAIRRDDAPIDERTVDVWVGRLRRAFAAVGTRAPIRTVRSLGYVFDS